MITEEEEAAWKAEVDLCSTVVQIEEIRYQIHCGVTDTALFRLIKYAGERSDVLWGWRFRTQGR